MTDLFAPAPQLRVQALSGSLFMLLLGFSGMMIGLAIDLQSTRAETIVSLCTRSHSLRDSVVLHAALLPATNIAMLASGIAAACYAAWPHCNENKQWHARYAPLLPYIGCCLSMLAGMFLSEWLAPQLASRVGLSWSFSAMTGAMTLGMIAGMTLWAAITAFAVSYRRQ